jgi:DNA replication protein DnaC
MAKKKEQIKNDTMLEKCYTLVDGYRHFDYLTCIHYLNHLGKQQYGSSFSVKQEDRFILHKLLCYAVQAENRCAEYGIDLKKGILLTGPVGCGKTSLMSLLPAFMFAEQRYQVKNTREIAAEFQKEGFDTINKYGKRQQPICLDDLGVEQNSKHFGNACNTIGEVLLYRYDHFINQGIVTHATTNLNADELEKLYGNRVRSRLRSMFNLISFPATSMDKRK